jgi:hypothetical protein|tara:strand:+ start:394 stop:561 length:168 start_codon:yes stop_codon:yes gene_type:complete
MIKKLKEFISWPIEMVRTGYTKLVDKIFGKRCSCPEELKYPYQPRKCQKCGKIHD